MSQLKCSSDSRIVIFSGSGVSSESGIPTFRGKDGLWNKHRPEDLATFSAFKADPEMVWSWYQWRREKVMQAEPNPAHIKCMDVLREFPKTKVITQNVDDLYERAGLNKTLHLHGEILKNYCSSCGQEYLEPVDSESFPPNCSACGNLVRPGVVWFGESLDSSVFATAQQWSQRADVFVVVGTSGQVQPAASLVSLAQSGGAYCLEINPEQTILSKSMDRHIQAPASQGMEQLFDFLMSGKK